MVIDVRKQVMAGLLLLLLAVLLIVDGREIHVSSNGSDDVGCGLPNSPCQTLEFVASDLLTNDTQIIIDTPGVVLSDIAVFRSKNNLKISGQNEKEAEITCNCSLEESSAIDSNCGMVFEHTNNVELTNLMIIGCSMLYNVSSNLYYESGILIRDCTTLTLNSVTVSQSVGTGMLLMNLAGNIEIINSSFTNNTLPFNMSTTTNNEIIHGGSGIHILISACDVTAKTCNKNQSTRANYIIQNTLFMSNALNLTNLQDSFWPFSYGGGLGILLVWGVKENTFNIDNTNFTGNKATCGSGFILHCHRECYNNTLNINGSHFNENIEATYSFGGAGAAMGIAYNKDIGSGNNFTVKHSKFTNNRGYYGAGLLLYIAATRDENCTVFNYAWFYNCTWEGNMGSVSPAVEVEPEFQSQHRTQFIMRPLFENCYYLKNHVVRHYPNSGKYPYTYYKEVGVFLIIRITVYFKGINIFESNSGTALYVSTSSAVFMEGAQTKFQYNTGERGGAVALVGYSSLRYMDNTQFLLIDNQATFVGGAIYVLNFNQHVFLTSHTCFLEYADFNIPPNVSFFFEGNRANSGLANSIFLTTIDPCRFSCLKYKTNLPSPQDTFRNDSCIGTFYFDNTTSKHIASEGSIFNLLQTPPLSIIPGRQYILPLQVLDDMGQNVTQITVYQSNISVPGISIDPAFNFVANNSIELTGKPRLHGNLTLSATGFRGTSASIPIVLSACPPGYIMEKEGNVCVCSASRSKEYTYNGIIGCQEVKGIALVTPGYWVGYITSNVNDNISQYNLYTSDCPSGFCRDNTENTDRYFKLVSEPNKTLLEQTVCAEHRHGTMCSQCSDGYTVYFHSNTRQCGENKLCHLGFLFYVLSELLPITVIFVTIIWLDISLTSGTAYSVIFMVQMIQAMIVSVNGAVTFKPKFLQDFYVVAYNALNLDIFDIDEMSFCLWKGAGTLDLIAMKYVSVVFAILLVFLLIFLLNHCSCKLRVKWCQKCTVHYSVIQGLTAFLVISYFQLAQVTFLLLNRESPQGIGGKSYKHLAFWDGSLQYFHGKHLVYAIPAMMCLLIVVIPLPLVLTFDSFLIKLESYFVCKFKFFRDKQPWTKLHNQLKPLLDSFQGTFKDKFRFFSGLFFLYRILILATLVLSHSAIQYYFLLEAELVVLLTVQAILQPFENVHHNIIALLVFCNMLLINSLTMRIYGVISTSGYTVEVYVLQWIQLLLIYIPMIVAVEWLVWKILKRFFVKSSIVTSPNDDGYVDHEFPEELFNREDIQKQDSGSIRGCKEETATN